MNVTMRIGARSEPGREAAQPVVNPRLGATIAEVPDASLAQVDDAVAAAAAAFQRWSRTTPAERAALLLKLADGIEADADAYADIEALNCGKPRHLVLRDEIPAVVDCFRFFAGAVRCLQGPVAGEYLAGHTSMIRRDAVGVVASIAPWNYPLMMAAWKLAPALAAGNTVVLKPAELTPLSTAKLADHLAAVFPPGVANVVFGRGETVGAHLTAHPDVAMVSVTGDIGTGRKIMGAAIATIKRTHLELGGKAPVIIMDDADIAEAVDAIKIFGFYNAGQDCTAACRIYCHSAIYDRFVADLAAAIGTLVFDHANDAQNDIGPLISARQRDRVAGFVDRARGQPHITVAAGGAAPAGQGFYYRPTLIAGALQTDEIVRREVFGPVVSVTRFDTPDQAIDWANKSEYGLASSVWSKDLSKALSAAAALRYGCTWINTHFMLANEMPHGGLKHSGYGKDLSLLALEDYTVARHIMMKL
jgi:aminobutyraldehyde dehydrogenase